MAQLSDRSSLRDIVENISAQSHRLYHLGSAQLTRSNLSRINNEKPYSLYEALFAKLLMRCQGNAPRYNFVLLIPFTRWMHRPLIYVCQSFPGQIFAPRKAQ
ncbi:MAG: hypothetical protein ACI9FD_003854 [Gammaproteobacteria bacterium]|jgi:hypothetical protein